MAWIESKDYALIVWWEDPRKTFTVIGRRRRPVPTYVVECSETCDLWLLSGGLEVDSRIGGDRSYSTFWCSREITIELKRDPFKTRLFKFTFTKEPGQGFGALDFLISIDPHAELSDSNSFYHFDMFSSTHLSVVRTLILPKQTETVKSHLMRVKIECSGQWGALCRANYTLESLLE